MNKSLKTFVILGLFVQLSFNTTSNAQLLQAQNSSEIELSLQKLNVLGSVLYVAAHPDDENTSLISYFSNELKLRTAYLSLTRGDGGQNLLGNEKGDLLGVLRTQELLSARKLDKGEQYFTRAVDFGYSKTAEETLRNWYRELILYDMVKVIRQFKPDVIITRFSKVDGGHGHHLSSAILAEEAFYAAADPKKFPEQLKELDTWQAKRLVWNTWNPTDKATSMEIGGFNPLLGLSYAEMAARSRSMHKSQGFGVSARQGSRVEEFEPFAGVEAKGNIFEDLDFSWKRVHDSEKIQVLIENIQKKYDTKNPHLIVPDLVQLYSKLTEMDNYWAEQKRKEVNDLIRECSGLWIESDVEVSGVAPGNEVEVTSSIINRSGIDIQLSNIKTTYSLTDTLISQKLKYNSPVVYTQTSNVPENNSYTQPYWLEKEGNGKMFAVPNPDLIGKAENDPDLVTTFVVVISGLEFSFSTPVAYKWNDAVKGEQRESFAIRPKVSLSIGQPNYIFADNKTHEVQIHVQAKDSGVKGELFIELPEGWKAEPEKIDFDLKDAGDNDGFVISVTPQKNAVNGVMKLLAKIDDKFFSNEVVEIDYDHIPRQTVLREVKTNLIKLDIDFQPKNIAYIMGSGDEIPDLLAQLGFTVELLSDDDLDNKDLSQYDAIICGIRAFNMRERLATQQKRLIEYVEQGGTWLVQHNTRFGKQTPQIGPYPFNVTGRSRIAEETAVLKILDPNDPLMNYPNKISEKDFEGWIQERGLYFADDWDEKYTPLLSGNDLGETPKSGGLLYTKYGKGVFVFSGYSFFRELPAGVPGAYRLFINLISAKGDQVSSRGNK
ncbi:MAG: PIG-L family deacetylase [Bacteroidetes bacterium]|nr:PIG-L family deacetylase [Bacteroidota bacterium]